ncbi:hypothetical protein [Actinacidiphila bryophytorum]|uniref:hypothetical protein n=1 Tax=Actinacidiphila bryophytorum TaxID=1436133 RepID=UPI002176F065|nr:hypothetical protein [Actinacidiphila bryophytorum]UWE13447.1 hypothetical protein NYE86_35420 [Actinacidiphila bryophytorum]
MPETPYDAERSRFTREGLARLVLSDDAMGLAAAASALVSTRQDPYCGPGGRASEAVHLIELAERLLASAVIYERERGSSWQEIAQYLGIDPAEAEARFTPDLAAWATAFAVPYRPDKTGRKRVPQLPPAAYDPAWACKNLDRRSSIHHLGTDDPHAVSATLPMTPPDPPEEPSP